MSAAGKILMLVGVGIFVLGLVVRLAAGLGIDRLPGDLLFQGKRWTVFVPLTSMLLLSGLVTLLFWLLQVWRRP